MRAYERFLHYISFETASDAAVENCPSTESQRAFARVLAEEMKAMGILDVRVDEHGYVYGAVPATDDSMDTIGLIAHMDTVDDVPPGPVKPRIIEGYDGRDISLANGLVISTEAFPSLAKYAGQDMIVTDGNTLLGADDKAGIAEILTMCERLLKEPGHRHGRVAIAFTPDEEIGRGADLFDVEGFGAKYAYTVDGGEVGEINYETFNAASAKIEIHGVNIHPGSAKNRMKNAALIAAELAGLLPAAETPAHTEGYEGFYHLNHIQGDEERATLSYILRDHDADLLERKKEYLRAAAALIDARYGPGTAVVEITDSYRNMKDELIHHMHVVRRAESAMERAGIAPVVAPVRGGTDGARLTFMGLPCPNLSTGGMNAHGRLECISVQSLDKMVEVLMHLVTRGATGE